MAHHPDPACVLVLVSPDGALRLLVTKAEGDFTIGFEDYEWHTHGDLLVEGEETQEEAVGNFIQEILLGKLPIVIEKKGGSIRDISVDYPEDSPLYSDPAANPYREADESFEVRRWIS
jgi:hypothetical protein